MATLPKAPISRGDPLSLAVQLANGKKRFVQSISATTGSAFTTLTTTTVDGTAIPAGALYMVQPDGDCQVEFNSIARTLTNTNSLWVQAGQQEWQYAEMYDIGVNLKGRSATVNVQVFVIF